MYLASCLGRSRVLTRWGERRLWVLNENDAVLWDLVDAGLHPDIIAELVSEHLKADHSVIRRELYDYLDHWSRAGLLETSVSPNKISEYPDLEELPQFPPPTPFGLTSSDWPLRIACQTIVLRIEDVTLRREMEKLVEHLLVCPEGALQDHLADHLRLTGDATSWQMFANGMILTEGVGEDDAIVGTLSQLSELACRTAERLIVMHGAGLVSPRGHGVLMAATGGAGKTTLAMSLEAEGFRLLSDDVVPIDRNGAALGLGLPACVKQGSLPILADRRPKLTTTRIVSRFGQDVRYLPPRHSPMTESVVPRILLFPHYKPDVAAHFLWVRPEVALQRLIEADAVIRDLTQEKLDDLCKWIDGMPAYALNYPTLKDGIGLVHLLLESIE